MPKRLNLSLQMFLDTNFTKDDLMQSYANKRAETETKMANTGNKIVQEQQRIRNEKEKSAQKFDDDKNKASTKIQEGQNAVTAKKEQIKMRLVNERRKVP